MQLKRRLVHADADGPNWRQRNRRRQSDIDFLSWLKDTSLDVLRATQTVDWPQWRVIAIDREIRRRFERMFK